MAFKIYGHSDDLIEIEEIGTDDQQREIRGTQGDELNAGGTNIVIGQEEASENQNAFGVRVGMRYAKGGCWEARIAPIGEDIPCPWRVEVTIEGYTAIVNVFCPLGMPIKWKRVRRS